MGVSKNRGTPKWMVYKENPINMDDLGVPPFKETPIYTLPETNSKRKRPCKINILEDEFPFWPILA